ncbi:MAG TPA: transposase [Ktedonobacteraceae bacterium]|nr:transposase [Ktedonobacteraceae bacterium]
MGQATRTTKLLLDLGKRDQGGANTDKQAALTATVEVLNRARAFYIQFFLAHPDKLAERVSYFSEKHQEERERLISPNELLTWAEALTVATRDHPHPLPSYNFSQQFPEFPFIYRRSVIKDAIGKVRSYHSHLANWQASGKNRGLPGSPGATNHPTLYSSAFCLDLDAADLRPGPGSCFARLKVYTGVVWQWHHYPVKLSRYFEARWRDPAWEQQSPKLILQKQSAALHFPQVKAMQAKKVKESKQDPHLVTVAIDLNVKNLAVITVRQHDRILETVFVRDHGLDQQRYRHLRRIAKKQWQSGKPVKGEHSNQQLWGHVGRMNEDVAHKVSRIIANVCAKYPGCVLLFERLRTIKAKGGSKSRRMNRKRANQLRGQIRERAKDKAYAQGTVTVEVNPHGTSQYCSRCGAKGERFSYRGGKRITVKWGKLFACPVCHYVANADFNASVNVHRSFYREWHWQPRKKPPPQAA